MEFSGKYLAVLFIFSIVSEVQAWRSFVIDFSSYKDEANDDYVRCKDLKLVRIQGHNAINGTIMLKRDLKNLSTTFDVVVPRTVGSDWVVMNVTIDICAFLEKATNDRLNLPAIILGQLQKSTSFFPSRCPLEKDQLIHIEDMYMDAEKFPRLMPDMPFTASLVFREGKDTVMRVMVEGAVQSKKANRKTKQPKEA